MSDKETAAGDRAAQIEAMLEQSKGTDIIVLLKAKEAAKKAIDDNFSRYSPVAGYPALRNAIVAKLKNENGLEYTAGQISCANGAKQSVCNTVMVLVNPGCC